MSARFDPLAAIEAAYAAPAEDEAWLRGVAEAFRPLARGMGVTVVSFDLEGWRPVKVAGATLDQPPSKCSWSAKFGRPTMRWETERSRSRPAG